MKANGEAESSRVEASGEEGGTQNLQPPPSMNQTTDPWPRERPCVCSVVFFIYHKAVYAVYYITMETVIIKLLVVQLNCFYT